MFIHMAVDTLGVAPEKKTQLEKIQSDMFTAMAPARDANRAVIQALADGVAAGKIDTAKSGRRSREGNRGIRAEVHQATITALNALHQALSPEERMALMDKPCKRTQRCGRK